MDERKENSNMDYQENFKEGQGEINTRNEEDKLEFSSVKKEAYGKTVFYNKGKNIVYYILGVIEALLLFRLLFKLLAANPKNAFVDFIYSITNILGAPFFNIFGNVGYNGREARFLFEPGTIIAMLVYAVAAAGIVKLIKIGTVEAV